MRFPCGETGGNIEHAVARRLHPSQQRDAVGGEAAEVDGIAAIGARDRGVDPDRPALLRRHLEQAEGAKPPRQILSAVTARHAGVLADREKDAAAGAMQFFRDLRARCA
jgi:hypothetical protein